MVEMLQLHPSRCPVPRDHVGFSFLKEKKKLSEMALK
jgi:hypothetical protein